MSGTSAPEDAPPSKRVLAHKRRERRNSRLFYTIDYSPRVSYLDPRSDYHKWGGFFNLFWIGLALMFITKAIVNIRETGYAIHAMPWSVLMANVWSLGASDLAMVLSTTVVVPFNRLCYRTRGFLRWSRWGMTVHSVYQFGWLVLWVNWPFMLDWTWTAQVFFMLHTITFLMKMHSYAFYNGHLSETAHRLRDLDKPAPDVSMKEADRYPLSASGERPEHDHDDEEEDQVSRLREELATELTSPLGSVTYPANLTWSNYVDYAFCPAVCYELEYPRSEDRSWMEVGTKALAVFGCIFLLYLLSGEFISPVLSDAQTRLHSTQNVWDQVLIVAETTSMLLYPFMIALLLVFLVIFEYVLGAFAEITRFADRRFYSDWWNSCDWYGNLFLLFCCFAAALCADKRFFCLLGWSFRANGIFQCIIFFDGMCTFQQRFTSPRQEPWLSRSWSALLPTSWS